ncbi:hypothetical protein GCK32_020604, partial [Trichostrongylus colubriformis]
KVCALSKKIYLFIFILFYDIRFLPITCRSGYKVMFLFPEKQSEEWGYVDKSAWKGICKSGMRQSPIDLDISE